MSLNPILILQLRNIVKRINLLSTTGQIAKRKTWHADIIRMQRVRCASLSKLKLQKTEEMAAQYKTLRVLNISVELVVTLNSSKIGPLWLGVHSWVLSKKMPALCWVAVKVGFLNWPGHSEAINTSASSIKQDKLHLCHATKCFSF